MLFISRRRSHFFLKPSLRFLARPPFVSLSHDRFTVFLQDGAYLRAIQLTKVRDRTTRTIDTQEPIKIVEAKYAFGLTTGVPRRIDDGNACA